jgi:hypothetical protein
MSRIAHVMPNAQTFCIYTSNQTYFRSAQLDKRPKASVTIGALLYFTQRSAMILSSAATPDATFVEWGAVENNLTPD